MPSEVQEPQRLVVSRKRIALARLPIAPLCFSTSASISRLGLALQEIGDAARQVPPVAMHDEQRTAFVAAADNGSAPAGLVDDRVRHAAQRDLDARPDLRPLRHLGQPLLQPALMAVRGNGRPRRARMPGGTVMRRPRPPASMRSVSRRARSFSTMRSGSVRPATTCSRSWTGAGVAFVRLRKKPKDIVEAGYVIRRERPILRLLTNASDAKRKRRRFSATPFSSVGPRRLRFVEQARWSNPCRGLGRGRRASTCCGWP